MTTGENTGPWPERISPFREIMWMVAAIVLGLLIIPAAIAVPFALIFKSEGVFIWLLIGGAVAGGILAFRFYKKILRKRALAAGRFIEYRSGNLILPADDASAGPETWPITSAKAGWYSRHGGTTSGTMEFLWLRVESPRGVMKLTTDGEALQGEWLRGVPQAEDEKTPDIRLIRMFGPDLGDLIRLVLPG